MRSLKNGVAVVFAVAMLASCSTYHSNGRSSTAPGQVKKVTGAKSAKDYAPGQQKIKDKE
ncbi:MAG: hypothetical protein R2819_15815 [Allomuricauda sp.]